MKEIGKLLGLLNEYRKEKGERSLNEFEVSQTLDSLNYLRLFIKWLVENDKIDTRNLNLQVFKSMFSNDGTVEVSYEELILMLLAIQDEPINFLLEILK